MTHRVLVVGSGLIGTSIAIALVAGGHDVFVADTDAKAQSEAQQKSGAHAWDGEEQVDLVVVATPPEAVAGVLRAMTAAQPSAVITDVASVKESVFSQLGDLPVDALTRVVGSGSWAVG